VSVPFSSVAFSSFLNHGRNLSQLWVVDSACSINLTAFEGDFVRFTPPSAPSRVAGVGVDVKDSGSVRISVRLASCRLIHRTIHALYTPDLSSRSAQRVGRLLSVSWMQTHNGCELIFPSNYDTGVLVVPTGMGVLEPSGNGLYLLPHQLELPSSPSAKTMHDPSPSVALAAQSDPVLWHRRFGHINIQSLQAHHTHGVPTSHALPKFAKNVSCDSCLLHKATVAPRSTAACAKPSRPLLNMSSDLSGLVNVPSPHGLRYNLLVIDHHTHYMWVRFLKSNDDACSELETILLNIKHLHPRHHFQSGAFAPVIKSDSDSCL
jgi:hypothetical protein